MTVIEWAKSKGYKPELVDKIDLEVSIPKSERMIMSFDGLEEFKNLKTFLIRDSDYDFSNIDFSKLKNLKRVNISDSNNFKSLDFSKNNLLSELRIINCKTIEYLKIEGINIRVLHLLGSSELQKLDIENLPLNIEYVEIDATKLEHLKQNGFLNTIKTIFADNYLNKHSDRRGEASILDTGLFDFKTN